jgi:hypothetical protein
MWTDCLENVESSTSHNPIGLHGLLRGSFNYTCIYNYDCSAETCSSRQTRSLFRNCKPRADYNNWNIPPAGEETARHYLLFYLKRRNVGRCFHVSELKENSLISDCSGAEVAITGGKGIATVLPHDRRPLQAEEVPQKSPPQTSEGLCWSFIYSKAYRVYTSVLRKSRHLPHLQNSICLVITPTASVV